MKKHQSKLKSSLLFFMMLPVLFHANIAMGLSDEQRKIFNYSIPYFNTGGECGSGEIENNGDDGGKLSPEEFVQKYGQAAYEIGKKAGIPYEIILSQAAVESGWGGSTLSSKYNNFFGIKASSAWKGKVVNMKTKEEYTTGTYTTITDGFRVYDTPQQGFEGYAHFIHDNSNYKDALNYRDNPQKYIEAVKAGGYATASDYVSTIMSVEKDIARIAQDKLGLPPSSEMTFEIDPAYANHEETSGDGSDDCSGLSGSNNEKIAKLAEEWGKWGVEFNACYIWSGPTTRTKEFVEEAVANHFTGKYGVDCSGFVTTLIYKATGYWNITGTQGICNDKEHYEEVTDPKPGDIPINCARHVEIITKVNPDGSFETVGSHKTGCGEGYGPSPGKYNQYEKVLRFKG